MKEFKIPHTFYIAFFLVLAFPISYFASISEIYLNNLTREDILFPLAGLRLSDTAITIILLMLIFWLVERWLWRIKGLPKVLPIPHDLNGRYKGVIISSYDQDKTYEVFIEIEQTMTRVSLALYREASHSETVVASVGKNQEGNWCLYYIYDHKVGSDNSERDMKDHQGVAFLEIFSSGTMLKGNYFNNPRERGRYGTIEARRISRNILGKY